MSIPDKYADWKGSRVGMQPSRASASLSSRLLAGFSESSRAWSRLNLVVCVVSGVARNLSFI
jgi:hypothetical protein